MGLHYFYPRKLLDFFSTAVVYSMRVYYKRFVIWYTLASTDAAKCNHIK